MTWSEWVSELWIIMPVGFLMLAGCWLTVRSGWGNVPSRLGLRLMVVNLTSTLFLVSVCLMLLGVVQAAVGYRLSAAW